MNQEPDNYEYSDRIYGTHWTVAFAIPAVIWIVALCLLCVCFVDARTLLISSNIDIDANGNTTTVPLVGQ